MPVKIRPVGRLFRSSQFGALEAKTQKMRIVSLSHENQEWPWQTKPKKGQFMNFSQGHSGTKVRYLNRACFSKEKTPQFTKMGEIHELFVLALSLVWFAGAAPEKNRGLRKSATRKTRKIRKMPTAKTRKMQKMRITGPYDDCMALGAVQRWSFETNAKQKRERRRDSQPRPRPGLNSQLQGATKNEHLKRRIVNIVSSTSRRSSRCPSRCAIRDGYRVWTFPYIPF